MTDAQKWLINHDCQDKIVGTWSRTDSGAVVVDPPPIYVSELMEFWAKQKHNDLVDLLRKVEFIKIYNDSEYCEFCPFCYNDKDLGHTENCETKKFIKDKREEQS